MLSKLLKYELRATSRLLIPLYLVMIFMSIINRFSLNLNEHQGIVVMISAFLMITYVASIAAVLIVTFIYMITRFYKNLLTDEGYLMFTLPAKTHELITSKLLITMLWTIVGIAAVLLSLFIAFANAQTMPQVISGIKDALIEMNRELGGSGLLMIIELIIMILLGLVSNILLIYLSIAVGQLYTKHKIMGSFAAYMIIYMILQFLAMVVVVPLGVFVPNIQLGPTVVPYVIFPIGIIVLLVGCGAFYLGTNYIFKRKLNLD